MYWANICLFDADMLVFLDESGFVSWHATDLHVQSYRVKIFFFWKCWLPAKENPQILRINYFDDIADFLSPNWPIWRQRKCCLKICLIKPGRFFLYHFLFTQEIRKLFSSMCKVQWVFVSLAFPVLEYKLLGLTEFLLLLWFYTSLIVAAGHINLVSSYLRVFNTWKHNVWEDKIPILLRASLGLHWENKTEKSKRSIWLAFL